MFYRIIYLALGIIAASFTYVDKVLGQAEAVEETLIKVEEIKIEGNTVFSDSELKKITNLIQGRSITIEQLLKVKNKISQYYIDRGYISSGAFLPQQNIEDGDLVIKVVEGSLAVIEIEGLSSLIETYVKARLPKLEQPLKVEDLAQALKRLEEDPLIEKISGELKILEPGKNLLSLEIIENKPIQIQQRLGNTFSPTIGNFGGSIAVLHQNLLGFGDRASVNYTKTEGLDRYEVDYSLPFNASGGRVVFNYNNADSELIEEAISAFDINADFEAYKLSLQQPIFDREVEKLSFFLELEKLRSETFVAEDISFPFVDGLDDGVSRITPLRIGQTYFRRGNRNLITANSQFNVGLDIFDVTENSETGIDGSFWSWQGDVQWIKAFDNDGSWQFRTSLLTQLTPDKLLPIEQLTVGGLGTVRGYRQNLIVGDNGLVAIAEGQLPIIKSEQLGNLFLVPFVDFGTVWSNDSNPTDDIQTDTLLSLGLELNYRIEELIDAEVFYAIPLSSTEEFGDASVEERWGFSLSVIPLRF